MGIKFKGGAGGSSLAVRNDLIFNNVIDRDDFFTTNPSQLTDDLNVVVNGELQKYVNGSWVNMTPIIQGGSGADAPELTIQYSANGHTGWSATLNPALHKFWRWSTDNGVTWAPVPPATARFSASDGGAGVPDPFEYSVSPEGKLQLLKGGVVIATNDEYGGWVKNSVTTGTGSLHLGKLHSIGSANENVVFKNEDSTLAWHPCWGAISADGSQVVEQAARVHSDEVLVTYPADSVGTATVDYNSVFTVSGNFVFLYLDIIPKESYTGELTLTVSKPSNGKEVSKFEYAATYTANVKARVPFKYPLWMFTGQQFHATITKPDGSFLKVTANQAGTEPYREAAYRTFQDEIVFHNGNAALQAIALNALTGAERISASAVRDFPVMTNTVLGMAKLGATMSISGAGELNTAVSPTGIKIVADEAGRLALPQSGGAILAIQQDNGFTYGTEAGQDTSINENWKQIGTVATNVVSFNGRNGAVVPTSGDYDQKQIKTVHDDTGAEGFFGIDNNGIYWDSGV